MVTESPTLAGVDGPEALKGARPSANFLQILGVAPLTGRGFLPEEENLGSQVAMISETLWRRRFGGDPRIAGRTVRLAAAPYTIVGVLPAGFQFPFPNVKGRRRRTTVQNQAEDNSPFLSVFGRLKPNVSLGQASAELAVINRQYALAYPGRLDAAECDRPSRTTERRSGENVRSMLWMLFGAVGFVLIIACLKCGQSAARTRGVPVAGVCGAGCAWSGARTPRQATPCGKSSAGVSSRSVGLLLAKWCLSGIASMPGLDLPRASEIHLDTMVLGFAVALSRSHQSGVWADALTHRLPAGSCRCTVSRRLKRGNVRNSASHSGRVFVAFW